MSTSTVPRRLYQQQKARADAANTRAARHAERAARLERELAEVQAALAHRTEQENDR